MSIITIISFCVNYASKIIILFTETNQARGKLFRGKLSRGESSGVYCPRVNCSGVNCPPPVAALHSKRTWFSFSSKDVLNVNLHQWHTRSCLVENENHVNLFKCNLFSEQNNFHISSFSEKMNIEKKIKKFNRQQLQVTNTQY